MPAKWFTCPDGCQVEIAKCLTRGCRMSEEMPAGRCLSVRTLRLIAEQRKWEGVPSTTQLLKGTREAYLEITTEYALDPQKALFRILGTNAHALLEQYTDANELAEERLTDNICSGAFDFYDPETETLHDTKTSGSYKIRKALGFYQKDVETGEVYKTGAKKGQPKTRKEWFQGGRKDRLDWAIQLNDYRIKLEQILPDGLEVKTMVIEAIVRDGGVKAAAMNGVEQNGVLIPINRMPDRHINGYMRAKRDALLTALETGTTPKPCRHRECWGGRKCDGWCNVREICQELRQKEFDEVAKEVF